MFNPYATSRLPKSFVIAMANSANPSIYVKRETAVFFSAEEAQEIAEPIKMALVGKLSFCRLPIYI